jgi:hypothetical protein
MVELFKLSIIPDDIEFTIEVVKSSGEKESVIRKDIQADRNIKLGLITLLNCIYPDLTEPEAVAESNLIYNISKFPWSSDNARYVIRLQESINNILAVLFEMINRNYKVNISESNYKRFETFVAKIIQLLRQLEINIVKNSCKQNMATSTSSNISEISVDFAKILKNMIISSTKYTGKSPLSSLSISEPVKVPSGTDSFNVLVGNAGQITRRGVTYDITPVAQDGDCLFNSVLGQTITNASTAELRRSVAKYIRSSIDDGRIERGVLMDAINTWYADYADHPELVAFGALGSDAAKINRYLEILVKTPDQRVGVQSLYWGYFVELNAIAMMRNIRINIIFAKNSQEQQETIYRIPDNVDRPDITDIYVYFTGNHYNIARPVSVPVSPPVASPVSSGPSVVEPTKKVLYSIVPSVPSISGILGL